MNNINCVLAFFFLKKKIHEKGMKAYQNKTKIEQISSTFGLNQKYIYIYSL